MIRLSVIVIIHRCVISSIIKFAFEFEGVNFSGWHSTSMYIYVVGKHPSSKLLTETDHFYFIQSLAEELQSKAQSLGLRSEVVDLKSYEPEDSLSEEVRVFPNLWRCLCLQL